MDEVKDSKLLRSLKNAVDDYQVTLTKKDWTFSQLAEKRNAIFSLVREAESALAEAHTAAIADLKDKHQKELSKLKSSKEVSTTP